MRLSTPCMLGAALMSLLAACSEPQCPPDQYRAGMQCRRYRTSDAASEHTESADPAGVGTDASNARDTGIGRRDGADDLPDQDPGREREADGYTAPDASGAETPNAASPDTASKDAAALEPIDAQGATPGSSDAGTGQSTADAATQSQEPQLPPACAPSAEDCFNGKDDDCDNRPDCADPDCTASAVCVSDGPDVGVLVPGATACPAGFTQSSTPLHRNPAPSTCSGCSCGAPAPVQCEAEVTASSWTDSGLDVAGVMACMAAATPLSSIAAKITSFDCAKEPNVGTGEGFSVGPVKTIPGICVPSGAPRVSPATWLDQAVFCRATKRGAGCTAGLTCAPRGATGTATCSQPSSKACGTGEVSDTWYASAADERVCAACACKNEGASCDAVVVEHGNDWSCSGRGTLTANSRLCEIAYSPIFRLNGYAPSGSCRPTTSLTGELRPTGPVVLCCRN